MQADLVRMRDAQAAGRDGRVKPVPGEQSVDALKTEVERWTRARDRSETWHGRAWEKAVFSPPQVTDPPDGVGKPSVQAGSLRIELADADAEVPLAAGAQLYVFDEASVEEGGRYLGAFRVEAVKKDADQLVVNVVPAGDPSLAEKKLWTKTFDDVTAFERLPSDSWLAFSRTQQPAAAAEPGADETSTDEAGAAETMPPTRKSGAEKLLAALESRLAEVERHNSPVAEDEWRPLVEEKKIPPGIYWATVEFTQPHEIAPAQYEAGDTDEFDLQTAVGLVEEKVAEIKQVVYRRLLTDAATALQGGTVSSGAGGTISTAGLVARRQALERQVAEITATLRAMTSGIEKTKSTRAALEAEQGDLTEDLDRWRRDAEAAEATASTFAARLEAAGRALDDAWKTVVQWGREYDGSMALLQAEIDKRAPAPR
jgi:hypothetical protein